ncbi:MAG: hypothetical protein ACOYO1_17490 [Bacteroidales bacterium]
MRKLILLAIALFICQFASAQNAELNNKRNNLTIGLLQGGGSLIGFDYEFMPLSHLGLQAGVGFKGFGCGLNYHFKPWARSSFLSLQYWHQGIDKTYIQSLIGPSYVYRARKIFSCQIGIGFLVEKGADYHSAFKKEVPVMLTYAVGFYFPW